MSAMVSTRAARKPAWHCGHCGAVLEATTPKWRHEESMQCTAMRNKTSAKLRGLASASTSGSLAVLVTKELGLPVEEIFDHYRRGAWGPGRKTSHCYVPEWIAELCGGNYYSDADTPTEEAERDMVHKLSVVLLYACTDLEVRAKLQACHALGGPPALLAIYKYAEEEVDRAGATA